MRSRRRVRESGFKQRTLLEMYLQLFISDCRLLETSLGERRTALFSNAKRVGKTLRTLFSLMGIERSRYCFIKSFTYSMDYFCSVSGWGICARCFKNLTVRHLQLFPKKKQNALWGGWRVGAGGFGHFGIDWTFPVPGGGRRKEMWAEKKTRGWDRGWERVPSSPPSPSFPPFSPLPDFAPQSTIWTRRPPRMSRELIPHTEQNWQSPLVYDPHVVWPCDVLCDDPVLQNQFLVSGYSCGDMHLLFCYCLMKVGGCVYLVVSFAKYSL